MCVDCCNVFDSPPYPVSYLTTIIKGVSSFGLFLPGVEVLQKVVNDANSWTSKAKELEVCICIYVHMCKYFTLK